VQTLTRVLVILAVLAIAPAFALPALARHAPAATPAPSPTPKPVEDPAVTKIARQQFVAWQAGVVNPKLYTQDMQAKMLPATLADTSQNIGALGPLISVEYEGPVLVDDAPATSNSYLYQMTCASGSVFMQFALLPDGKIAGMLFSSHRPGEAGQ
jgi:hypothetical protein